MGENLGERPVSQSVFERAIKRLETRMAAKDDIKNMDTKHDINRVVNSIDGLTVKIEMFDRKTQCP